MEPTILNGRQVSLNIKTEIKNKITAWPEKPGLAVIEVGDDPASTVYVKNKAEACQLVGINWQKIVLPEDCTPKKLLNEVEKLNADPKVNGILVQFPLPNKLKSLEEKIIYTIDPQKDVDGFHPYNVGQYVACCGDTCKNLLYHVHHMALSDYWMLTKFLLQVNTQWWWVGVIWLVNRQVCYFSPGDATVTICHSKRLIWQS